jgi:hypothetical protein
MPFFEALQALSAIATAVSLIYLARQTGAARTEADLAVRVSLLNAHDALTDRAMNINQIFIEHPELRAFFYDNQPLPEDAEPRLVQRTTAVAEHIADFIENALLHRQTLGPAANDVWEEYCIYLVCQSPTLRSYLTEHIHWYNAEVGRVLTTGLGKRD